MFAVLIIPGIFLLKIQQLGFAGFNMARNMLTDTVLSVHSSCMIFQQRGDGQADEGFRHANTDANAREHLSQGAGLIKQEEDYSHEL